MRKIASKIMQTNLLIINENQQGQRIDNFLFKHLKGVPKSHIYRILRKGSVRVNKKRVKPSYKLQLQDQIRLPPIRVAAKTTAKPSIQLMELLQRCILYEDENLLIINKPSGLAVHSGSGINFGVIEIVRAMRPAAKFIELVHRLDKETSGCLLLAKKSSILKELHLLLRAGKIKKIYVALLKGHWQGGSRKVDVPLLKGQVSAKGKPALTEFKPKQKFSNATLMQIILHTGRTHQIRIHAAYLDCSVARDNKYGDKEFNKKMRKLGLRRLFLHAAALRFYLPSAERLINVKADLDDDLLTVLAQLL